MNYREIVKKARKEHIIQFQKEQPNLKLTPIPCKVCGYMGKGGWANRSTICWRCRQKLRSSLSKVRE